MIHNIFLCPNCKRRSEKMKLLKNSRYDPNDENIIDNSFVHISNEILRCVCGRLLTWFDMIKVKEHIDNIGKVSIIEEGKLSYE